MSPAVVDEELRSLRRSFRIGLVAVAAALVAIGGVVAAFGSSADRPAGIAERWLVAFADTTRDGLEDDAVARMEDHQAPAVDGDPVTLERWVEVLPDELGGDHGAAADGKARFETVRVGRALQHVGGIEVRGVTALLGGRDAVAVPVEVTPYESDPVDGYVLMVEDPEGAEGWKVAAAGTTSLLEELGVVAPGTLCPAGRCPGFPIERPERAPLGFWLGTLALGVLIAAGCSLAARAATPKPGRPGAPVPTAIGPGGS